MADEPKAKNAIWITSGLAIVSACIAAIMEYGSATRLERQKFEYSLIEKALTSDEGILIEGDGDRAEATKRLEFLINIGVIKTLDENAIREAASNPNDLPTFQPLAEKGSFSAQGQAYSLNRAGFACANMAGDIPAMFATQIITPFTKPGEIPEIKTITVAQIQFPTEESGQEAAKERCDDIASRFEKISENRDFQNLQVNRVDNEFVLCVREPATGGCKEKVIAWSSEDEANAVLDKVTAAGPDLALIRFC